MVLRRRSLRLKTKKKNFIEKRYRADSVVAFSAESLLETKGQPTKACKYKYRGCKEVLPQNDRKRHEKECKFRWYKCEGKIFCNWDCNWTGYFEDIMNHFKEKHSERTYMTTEFKIKTKTTFDSNAYDLQLIRKGKQLFWYKFKSVSDRNVCYWLCQYVGPSVEATTYGYDFEIESGLRKLAVSELCHSDGVDADDVFKSGKCALLTVFQLQSFSQENDEISFRIKIKKRMQKK